MIYRLSVCAECMLRRTSVTKHILVTLWCTISAELQPVETDWADSKTVYATSNRHNPSINQLFLVPYISSQPMI